MGRSDHSGFDADESGGWLSLSRKFGLQLTFVGGLIAVIIGMLSLIGDSTSNSIQAHESKGFHDGVPDLIDMKVEPIVVMLSHINSRLDAIDEMRRDIVAIKVKLQVDKALRDSLSKR